ncbi:MAG: metal-dependent hydrolase [Polyangia bacterium]|jgi:L-ascorbate metabolism protein UlaG (beta-lactamase superfamily)|nr:metal-dependent hydrolase [Polyangia bacterium]
MPVKVTWLGHSATLIETDQVSLLIDPFLSGNEYASSSADEMKPDVIAITHGHGDHVGDAVEIAKRTGALCVANFEIVSWLQKRGVQNVHPQHIGGGFNYPWGRLKLTIAHHGSALPDGSYGGNPAGILLTLGGKTIYHAGDTGLFYDMKLIGDEGVDLAILPIGDNFTMGPEDAHRAVELIRPSYVIPIHYDTFEVIHQDPLEWAARAEQRFDVKALVLQPGESFTL